MNSLRAKILGFAIVTAGAFAPKIAMACAMCGLPPGDHQSHAYNTSVLFMMAAPYSIFGLAAIGFYAAYRNHKNRHADSSADQSKNQGSPRQV